MSRLASPVRRVVLQRRVLAISTLLAAGACAPPPSVSGAPSSAPSPASRWPAPAAATVRATPDEVAVARRGAVVAPELRARFGALTMTDVVDLALTNSPQTRVTWSQARAAAAAYGSAAGRFLPSLEFDVNGGPSKSVSQNPALIPATRTNWTPSLQLNYVLFDLGGRGGTMAAAHQALFAADFNHNATVANVVLAAQVTFFNFQAARGLLTAAQQGEATALANLAAAERRHDVGLATIADVLQARTALAQARLALQTAEGNVASARAALALAAGMDANTPFDVQSDTGTPPPLKLAATVDSLIEQTVRGRPEVAAARAVARQADAQVRAVRGALLPTVSLSANAGKVYSNRTNLRGETYNVGVALAVPIFSGNSRQFDLAAAQENAAAAAAQAEQVRLQAVAQVFTSYYAMQTATQRVATARELFESASLSEEVARGRYAEGVGSILDLLTAQSALADARAQIVGARWTWRAALAQLAHDVGVMGTRGETNIPMASDSTRRTGP